MKTHFCPFAALPSKIDRTQLQKIDAVEVPTRAFSTATSQTAPQEEFSLPKTAYLPTDENGRRPEQRHSRERASYGGTSAGGVEIFGTSHDETFRTPSEATSSPKVSVSSPLASSIQSPENFNVIKSVCLSCTLCFFLTSMMREVAGCLCYTVA